MDLISVIVPVYNVEKYLDACVESIVNQTYQNLEIILVDDGSPDNCPALCDAWAKRDSRIKVIHKENGGLSDARNAGTKIAEGTYIIYIDSDDYILPDIISTLHNLILANDADVAQCGFFKVYEDAPIANINNEQETTVCLNAFDAVNSLLTEGIISVTCWNKLIKSSIAKETAFDFGRINEDVLWTYRVLAKSKKVCTTTRCGYAYVQRSGSIMNSSYSEKRFDALYALRMRADSIKVDFPALYPIAERAYTGSCMYHYQTLCRLPKTQEYNEFKKRLHTMFCESDLKLVFSVTELKYKVWYTLFKFAPTLTCKVRNLLKIGL